MTLRMAEPLPERVRDNLAPYDALTQTLLYHRGVETEEDAERFIAPNYERDIADPVGILNMERAVERILKAMDKGERIAVYGDYDCDGIPGSVILHDFFKRVGYVNFLNYIPHRHKEGYGLNTGAIDTLKADGVSLIITVDLAITDVEEVAYAQSLGVDVIVTDHHLPGPELPPAYAVLNSKQLGDTYHDNMLSGAGVAWKLVQALLAVRREEWGVPMGWEKWLLDMAGLAAIADLVPLRKENRAIAHYGLTVLRKSPRLGLRKLFRKMRVDQARLTEDDIAFMLAPRINAASRMDIPMEAFRLLTTEDENVAEELATHLHTLNDTRKGLVAGMVREAHARLSTSGIKDVILIGNPEWRPGVLGLLASKLVEEYQRPAFVWGRGEEIELKGSCRSDGSVNVVELMRTVQTGVFSSVGGHEFSGGFSISHERIHELEDALLSAYANTRNQEEKEEEMFVDAVLTFDDVNPATHRKLAKLAPWGIGNPKPVFLFDDASITRVRQFGKRNEHLELIFKNSKGGEVSAIGFFLDPKSFSREISEGARVKLLASLEESYFRNRAELRLRIVEIL